MNKVNSSVRMKEEVKQFKPEEEIKSEVKLSISIPSSPTNRKNTPLVNVPNIITYYNPGISP